MRPAIIKSKTNRGIYYVVYPPGTKKHKATDQLRIAKMHKAIWNNQLTKEEREAQPIRDDIPNNNI